MKPGRNDPCPCGSGKKYKHCCLNSGAASATDPAQFAWRRMRAQLEGYVERMIRFIHQAYGPAAIHEAWQKFIGEEDVELDLETPLMQLFMPWFFACWSPSPADTRVANNALHQVTPVKAYLEAKGRQLDPLLRRYMESLLIMPFTFFEVMACDPGEGMTLRDILTQEEHAVTERSASKGLARADLLFGQLAAVDNLTMLEASNAYAIAPMEKAQVIELRARMAADHPLITRQILRDYDFELLDIFHRIHDRAFHPQMPSVHNTDDDPLVPHKLVFDLKVSPQAAFDALKHLAVDQSEAQVLEDTTRDISGRMIQATLRWTRRGNKMHAGWDVTTLGTITIDGARLTAEVNSAVRANTLRPLIESALGDGVRYRASEIQSLDKALAGLRAAGGAKPSAAAEESKRLAQLPEVRAKITAMMAAHWEHWVDQRIPMLGDRTPLDAVKDADGREIVESIVIQAERSGQTMDVPTDPAVFVRLRERLGLAKN
jgi:hypothetical protein